MFAVNFRTVQMFAEVIVIRVVTGLVSALGVVTARVQGLVNGNMSPLNVINGRAYNGSSAVIAAVLDGTLEVLAGEEAGAINIRNERHLGELSQERERTPELARRNPKVAKKRASERAMSKNSDNKPKAYLL